MGGHSRLRRRGFVPSVVLENRIRRVNDLPTCPHVFVVFHKVVLALTRNEDACPIRDVSGDGNVLAGE